MPPIVPALPQIPIAPQDIETEPPLDETTEQLQAEGLSVWESYLDESEIHAEDQSQGFLGQSVDRLHEALSFKTPTQRVIRKIATDRKILVALSQGLAQGRDILAELDDISRNGPQDLKQRARDLLEAQPLIHKNGDPTATLLHLYARSPLNASLTRKLLDEAYQLEVHGEAISFPKHVYASLRKYSTDANQKSAAERGYRAQTGDAGLARSTAKAVHGTSPEELAFTLAGNLVSLGAGMIAGNATRAFLEKSFQSLLRSNSSQKWAAGTAIRILSGGVGASASAATMATIQGAKQATLHDPKTVDSRFVGQQILSNWLLFATLPATARLGHALNLAFMNGINFMMVALDLAPMPSGGSNDLIAKTTVQYLPFVGAMKFSERVLTRPVEKSPATSPIETQAIPSENAPEPTRAELPPPPPQEEIIASSTSPAPPESENLSLRPSVVETPPTPPNSLEEVVRFTPEGKRPNRKDLEMLFQALADPNLEISHAASRHIIEYLNDPTIQSQLEDLRSLKDSSLKEREAAALGLDLALPHAETLLQTYKESHVRDYRYLENRRLVFRILSAFDRPEVDSLLRTTTLNILRRDVETRSHAKLISFMELEKEETNTALECIAHLGKKGGKENLDFLADFSRIRTVGADPLIAAIKGLKQAEDPRGDAFLKRILRVDPSRDSTSYLYTGIHYLFLVDSAQQWTELHDGLNYSRQRDTALARSFEIEVLQALARIGDPAAIPDILPSLKSDDLSVRANALDALGKISGPDSLNALLKYKDQRDCRLAHHRVYFNEEMELGFVLYHSLARHRPNEYSDNLAEAFCGTNLSLISSGETLSEALITLASTTEFVHMENLKHWFGEMPASSVPPDSIVKIYEKVLLDSEKRTLSHQNQLDDLKSAAAHPIPNSEYLPPVADLFTIKTQITKERNFRLGVIRAISILRDPYAMEILFQYSHHEDKEIRAAAQQAFDRLPK